MGGVKLEFIRNLLNSKICYSIDSKRQKVFKTVDENKFEFNSFDSIPTTCWSQIVRNWIRSNSFDSKIWNSIDSKGEKFDKN